ncbi:hypothetical protein [Longimicrobium sp.]|uniref:hypothetical protein n=1 Tax=Longimicrobium sp. TaxID=2029185 RepID=UPI003B3AF6EC
MKKLRLDPETLRVESFASDNLTAPARGTVDAYLSIVIGACSDPDSHTCPPTAYPLNTCGNSCQNDCFPTEFDCSPH